MLFSSSLGPVCGVHGPWPRKHSEPPGGPPRVMQEDTDEVRDKPAVYGQVEVQERVLVGRRGEMKGRGWGWHRTEAQGKVGEELARGESMVLAGRRWRWMEGRSDKDEGSESHGCWSRAVCLLGCMSRRGRRSVLDACCPPPPSAPGRRRAPPSHSRCSRLELLFAQ